MRQVVRAELLVMIGRAFGVQIAETLYLNLTAEPIDAHGAPVDWQQIRRQILTTK